MKEKTFVTIYAIAVILWTMTGMFMFSALIFELPELYVPASIVLSILTVIVLVAEKICHDCEIEAKWFNDN